MAREIGIEEVRKHNTSESVWIVIHNDVYDVTSFLKEHPGGEESLLEVAGKDGTEPFENVGHSSDARVLMNDFKIGTLSVKDRGSHSRQCSTLTLATLALLGALVLGYALKKSLS